MIKVGQTPFGERVAKDVTGAALGAVVGVIASKVAKIPTSPSLLGAAALVGVAASEFITGAEDKKAQDAQRLANKVPPGAKPPGTPASYKVYMEQRTAGAMPGVPTGAAAAIVGRRYVTADDWEQGVHPLDLLQIARLKEEHRGWLACLLNHGSACLHAYEQDLLRGAKDCWNYRAFQTYGHEGSVRLISQDEWEKRRLGSYRMECPPPTVDYKSPDGGNGTAYPFVSWLARLTKENVGKRIAPMVQSCGIGPGLIGGRTDELLQREGWENFGFKSAYSSVPWDNRKGTVPPVPQWWMQRGYAPADYYKRLKRYYMNGTWLVWAAEMWRLHSIVYPRQRVVRPTGNLQVAAWDPITAQMFVNGNAPAAWQAHCCAWGVGCANKARITTRGSWRGYPFLPTSGRFHDTGTWQHLANPTRPPIVARGFGGSIEDMLQLVMANTPPPGSIPTGTEIANDLAGEPKRLPDWPGNLGDICPGHYMPANFYEAIWQRQRADFALKPSVSDQIILGILAAVMEIVITVVTDGVGSAPAGFAIGALAAVMRLCVRYAGQAAATGRVDFHLSDLTAVAFKIVSSYPGAMEAANRLIGATGLAGGLSAVKSSYLDTLSKMQGIQKEIKANGQIGLMELRDQINWRFAPDLCDNIVSQFEGIPKAKRIQDALEKSWEEGKRLDAS